MYKSILFISLFLSSLLTISNAQVSEAIKVNQEGYYTSGPKVALVVGSSASSYQLLNTNDEVVHTGDLSVGALWDETNENVKEINFSNFTTPGAYTLQIEGTGKSYEFEISENVLFDASKEAARYYYYNRASMSLESQFAGVYARNAGHLDTDVIVCDNTSTTGRQSGTTFNSSGGWYDAGDYNKYISTAGISVFTLMLTYEQHPEYVESVDLNIPESNNSIPDLLDECLYELTWMETMQDTDGGVFHKVTNKGFGAFEMPDVHASRNGARYACLKNTSATLQFAAAMAAAYRIYEPIDQFLAVGQRDRWKQAAIRAWDWAEANPDIDAEQCGCEIKTGTYKDLNQTDEFVWAAAELYLATGDLNYYTKYNYTSEQISVPSWASNKQTLGIISLLLNEDKLTGQALTDYTTLRTRFRNTANYWSSVYEQHPYKITMQDRWGWGSNGEASNRSMILLTAHKLFDDEKYLRAGLGNIDYILGKNTTSFAWLTGFGDKLVQDAHHRISGADGITAPVPGMLYGGPFQSPDGFEDKSCCGTQAYANTEVTINWNAPLVFDLFAIQASLGDVTVLNTKSFGVKNVKSKFYPNPVENILNLEKEQEWVLLSNVGVELNRGDSKTVDLSSYDAGVYVLILNGQSELVIKK